MTRARGWRLLSWMAICLSALICSACQIHIHSEANGVQTESLNYDDPVLQQRIIFLTDELSESTGERVVRQMLFLNEQNPQAAINLMINSPGGSGFAAWQIIDMMKRIEAPVNTHAVSFAGSSSAWILVSGTGERTATPDAIVVFHGLKAKGRINDRLIQLLETMYAKGIRSCTRLPDAWFPMKYEVNHVLTADEALKYGVIDRISLPTHSQPKMNETGSNTN